MSKNPETPDFCLDDAIEMYTVELKSVPEIADYYGTYSNKVYRQFKKAGVERRTLSESNKVAVKTGRKIPPNKGKTLSEETKTAISESLAEFWDNVSEEVREKHRKRAQKQWEDMPESDKMEMKEKSRLGILEASKHGSKVEVAIREALVEAGIAFLTNHKGFLIDPNLEVDIFVPAYKAAIEIDGIFHHEAIHGQSRLDKRKNTDAKKDGLLIREDYWPIRIRAFKKFISKKNYRDTCSELINRLTNLSGKPTLINIDIE